MPAPGDNFGVEQVPVERADDLGSAGRGGLKDRNVVRVGNRNRHVNLRIDHFAGMDQQVQESLDIGRFETGDHPETRVCEHPLHFVKQVRRKQQAVFPRCPLLQLGSRPTRTDQRTDEHVRV